MIGLDEISNVVIWRVIASRRRLGHWEYAYDDYVLEPKLAEYIVILTNPERGVERITFKLLGLYRDVKMTNREHLVSADTIAHERKYRKLDTFAESQQTGMMP